MKNTKIHVPKSEQSRIKDLIDVVADFPIPGVNFLDISSLLLDHNAMEAVTAFMSEQAAVWGANKVLALDARGFIFASIVAHKMHLPLVMVRKAGKLPGELYRTDLKKEYGNDSIAIQKSKIGPGDRVLIVDDIIATGGTLVATQNLVLNAGAEIAGIVALADLVFLGGSKRLQDSLFSSPVNSFVKYEK